MLISCGKVQTPSDWSHAVIQQSGEMRGLASTVSSPGMREGRVRSFERKNPPCGGWWVIPGWFGLLEGSRAALAGFEFGCGGRI